jgi:peptide-methionine (S)-S-oxide reductase
MLKIGFGGSCHWCTEAIFRSLRGIGEVAQGWIGSDGENTEPSEAVIVHFDVTHISLATLLAIHLHTHSCTSQHGMRTKYRSAVYAFDSKQAQAAKNIIEYLQKDFPKPIITQVLQFRDFKLNEEVYLDYYYKDPEKPFCQNVVNPKLKGLLKQFAQHISPERQAHLALL